MTTTSKISNYFKSIEFLTHEIHYVLSRQYNEHTSEGQSVYGDEDLLKQIKKRARSLCCGQYVRTHPKPTGDKKFF